MGVVFGFCEARPAAYKMNVVICFHLEVFVSCKPIALCLDPGKWIVHAYSSGVQQRLRRDAADVRAVAPNFVSFD
jgi:hypothetical protein